MMLRTMMKSKIHRATITDANVNYVGSISIDALLLEKADLLPGELVHVWNVNNGERFETYILEGAPDSGQVVVNGAAARKVSTGDIVIITAFCLTDQPVTPQSILVDENNKYVRYL